MKKRLFALTLVSASILFLSLSASSIHTKESNACAIEGLPVIDFSSVFKTDREKQILLYVRQNQYAAIEAQRSQGIPASVKLAQGIIESAAGTSELSMRFNNDFGIKCHKRKCKPGHCVRRRDDTPNDRFVIYQSRADAWQAHSKLMQTSRYCSLRGLDYIKFSAGLKKCGYATEKNYSHKIIAIIERYKLNKIDKGIVF